MANMADNLVETLIAWDVKVVFGLPGDGINGIMEALRTRHDRIGFVQESAAFMACAYAKWAGKLGVVSQPAAPAARTY
jgi:pyruvate dehydrogenase (quinone)